MAEQLRFDTAVSHGLEAGYLSPLVAMRRQKVLALLDLHPGEAVLDIGTGPGFLAEEFAIQVGASGQVVGVDRSKDMLALAERRCAQRSQVSFHEADALELPLPRGTFDAAAAVQIYEFVHDVPAALRELHRVLRPRGRAVIVDTDWASLVWEAEDRPRAERVFNSWDDHLADPYLPRRLAPLLRESGFDVRDVQPYTAFSLSPEPFAMGLAQFIAGFVPGRRGVTAEDADAWLADLTATTASGKYFFSLTAFLFLATRA
jgi:SAM-dependent methyltransferase